MGTPCQRRGPAHYLAAAVQAHPVFGRNFYVAAERLSGCERALHTTGKAKSHPRVYSLNLMGRANQYDL